VNIEIPHQGKTERGPRLNRELISILQEITGRFSLARELYLSGWEVMEMLVSWKMTTGEEPRKAETTEASAGYRFVRKILKFGATMITVGAVAIPILNRGAGFSMHWCADEIAPLAGTLFLAVVVVLIANYLSAGRRSKAGPRGNIGYDRNASLDL
jgi:hypothetical protein